jgi:hypothetical protein
MSRTSVWAAKGEVGLTLLVASLWLNSTLNAFPAHPQWLQTCVDAGVPLGFGLIMVAWALTGRPRYNVAISGHRPLFTTKQAVLFSVFSAACCAAFLAATSAAADLVLMSVSQRLHLAAGILALPLLILTGTARLRSNAFSRVDAPVHHPMPRETTYDR